MQSSTRFECWNFERLASARASPGGLAFETSEGRWWYPRHLQLINRQLARVATEKKLRLMFFMPPRHGKSELISKFLPAWYLGRFPDRHVILTSHGGRLAEDFSAQARDVLTEYGPSIFNVGVEGGTSAARGDWLTVDPGTGRKKGGSCRARGVRGSIVGRGAHLFVIDDPVKSGEEALSEIVREGVIEWYRSTVFNRLEPGGSIIIVQTRWHEDDLSGQLLNPEKMQAMIR